MKKLLSLILTLMLILSLAATVYADVMVDIGDWSIAKTPGGKAWELRDYHGADTDVVFINKYGTMNVTSLGDHVFAENEAIATVTTNANLQHILDYAFINSKVTAVTLNGNLIEIARGAFSGTGALKSINLEDTRVQVIEDYTFQNSGIEQIALPSVTNTVGEYAFAQCASLTRIDIPDSVTAIADSAFDGCDSLVIYAASDSYAITYAKAHGINYVCTDVEGITYLIGDSDGDGIVTIVDATLIQRVLVELEYDADGMITLRADSVGDGLDILDATRIQRFLADMYVNTTLGTYAFHPLV